MKQTQIPTMCGSMLIFASDYPDNRLLQPEEIYDSYFDILGQMDFTQAEAEKIAHGNIEKILSV